MSLRKTLNPLLSTCLTQQTFSHNLEFYNWDIKHQHKQRYVRLGFCVLMSLLYGAIGWLMTCKKQIWFRNGMIFNLTDSNGTPAEQLGILLSEVST